MRQPKFRVWDGNLYHNVDELCFVAGGIKWYGPGVGKGWCFLNPEFDWTKKGCGAKPEKIDILEQFTGRTDNSCKGDIVAVDNGEGTDRGVIKYDTESASFFIDMFDGNTERLCDVHYKKIGTIHENPELL
jgi:hypothetical protein